MRLTGNKKITNTLAKRISLIFFILFAFNTTILNAQVTGISSGVTFNWQAPQSSVNDPAVLESIVINGRVYNTFVVPTSYDLVRLGPGGHSANTIFQDGTQIVSSSNNANWDSEALNAFQSLNLNHYFQSNGNGRNICGDQNALATTDAQIQSIYYNPGIPSNQNGVLAVTERNANNCIHISVYGYPSGGNTIEELGATFILPNSAQSGPHNNEPPSNGSDYWLTNKVNQNNGTIGIALFELSQLAPVGSTITEVRFTASTVDVADGKFFIMQEYAVDDIFDTEFNTAFNGDVGANDNVPDNSAYTYLPSVDPINGSVVVNLDGTFTYTPNPGFVGTDVFEVQVCLPAPNQAVCNTSSVTLTVNADNLPTAVDDSYTIEEDQVNNVFNVLNNDDYGLDGPASNNALVITNNPANGTATVNNNGTPTNSLDDFINYTPDPYYNGIDSLTYQITDGNGTTATATVAITVNDGNKNITLSNTNITVSEDAGVAVVTVTIYGNYQVPPTISYSTADNTANSGQDFSANTGTHTFQGNDGEEFEISIPILDDLVIENTETFTISVNSSSYVSPVNLSSTVSILDNDGGAGNGISVSGFNVNEDAGTADFTVTLNANVQGGFNVDYAISDGTAVAGSDYTVASAMGNIAFTGNAGEQINVSVTILDDAVIESTEDLGFALSNLSTNLINIIDGSATGTINDNDGGAGNGISVSGFNVNEDAGTADFTVTLNANVQGGFNVDYAISDGTAVAGSDYTVASAMGNIAFTGNAGEQINVSVTILDDALIESSEDLGFALSNLSTNLINIIDGSATGTINDNDGGAGNGISVSGFNVNEDAGTADFTVTLNANVQGGFNVDYAITDGSATAGDDYTVASATGNIAFTGNAGEQINVSVTILDDALIENSEDLSMALSNLSTNLINIIDGSATGTINDNDGGAGNGISVSGFNVNEDAGTADFTVTLNANVQGGFNVDYAITDGSAIAGDDYTVAAATGNIAFTGNAGEQINVSVTILDDALIESSEDLSMALSNLSTNLINIIDGNATGTINDNDGGAGNGISVSGFNVNEDAGTADFTVTLNANVQGGFNVDYAISDGTAVAGSDYTVAAATGNIAFTGNAGEQINVSVTILDDALIENSEDLSMALSNLSTNLINIIDGSATGTINDNDGGAGNGISVSGFNVNEDAGTADFTVTLNANVQGGFNVDYAITDGSATAGDDYTVASATGNIAFTGNAGEQINVSVTILDDALIESSEDLGFALSNLSTNLINIIDGSATGTINDNDGGAGNGISVSGFNVNEDAGTADFTVTLNANVQGSFNVDYAITDGSATAGDDYTVASATGNIAFTGNTGEQINVSVTILDDALIESSEDLSMALSNLSTNLINIIDGNATGTINDNDGGAGNGISVSGFNVNEDAGTADFTVTLNANVQGGFNVDYAISDGTAVAGNDYTVTAATGNFAFTGNAGEQINVSVTILDDALIENSEDLGFALSNLSTNLINIIDGSATGTINDNDGGAGNGISVSGFNVNEDAGTADFTVTLNANVQGGFNVDYAITDGSATAGDDYTVASATGNIAFTGNAGEQINVSVTILDDALIESSEDMSIALSNLSTNLINIIDGSATGTINDNDGGAGNGISVSGFNVDEDAGTADFTVTLNANVQGGFNVDYAISDGTAVAGSDYTVAAATGNIAFTGNAGEQINVSVTILDDALIENSEDLGFALSNLSTNLINIIDGSATGTINDNDGGAGNGISVSGFNVNEDAGTANFTVTLNANVQGGFNVDYAISDGTAVAGSDYTVAAATGNIAFTGNAGEQINVSVTILDDALIESSEDMSIALSNLSTNLINIIDGSATGTINDNDGGAGNGIQFDVTNINIDEGAGTVSLGVSLNVNVQEEFTVAFYTTDGIATNALDYTGIPQNTQTLTFGGTNNNNQTITISIIDDIIIENTENFQVILTDISTNLVNILSNDTATVNIIDNDGNEGYPTDVTIEACDVIPAAEVITVISTCATTVDFVEAISGQNDGCAVEYTITRTWTFTDCVGNVRDHIQIITIEDTQAPVFVEVLPTDTTVSCDNVPTAAILTASDSCDTNVAVIFDEQITDTDSCGSNYTITRTWSASDCAGNPVSHTQIITVEDTTAPTFVETLPTDSTVSCDNVPAASVLTAADNCDTNVIVLFDEQITDTDSCGSNYTITRTWSASDCAGNPVSHTQVITVEDTTAPTFVEVLPTDSTVSCDNVPVAAILTAADNCDTNITVLLNEQITDTDSCGSNYTITRTWSMSDCAGNPTTHTQVITVEDITAPTFVESLPQSAIVSCNMIPEAVTLTAIDNCDADVTLNFEETITNDSNCATGYTVTRVWTATDCAGNPTSHTQVLTVEPTGPITASPYDQEITIICGDEIPAIPALEFMGGCGNYQVEFNEETSSTNDTDDYMIVRTWDVTDSCGNTASFEQIIFVMQPQLEEIFIETCVEDEPINLINYLPESFDTNGTFEIMSGNASIMESTFNPENLEVGEYLIAYSSTEGTCKYYVDFTITVNSDCVPCGRDEIIVSTAVTANGDNINDLFTITGVEYCNYSFEVMIFNRWGDRVYESADYQNDWGGFAPSNAFGSAGMLPSGTYYYIINVKNQDIKPLNGYIYLGAN